MIMDIVKLIMMIISVVFALVSFSIALFFYKAKNGKIRKLIIYLFVSLGWTSLCYGIFNLFIDVGLLINFIALCPLTIVLVNIVKHLIKVQRSK